MSLSIGYSAIRANQVALETISNNIANAGTEGYHRQVVDMRNRLPVEIANLHRQFMLQFFQVSDDFLHRFFVEVEGRSHIVKNPEIVHNKTMGLVGIGPVGAANGL